MFTNACREYRNYQARRRVLRPAVSVANYDDYYDDYDYDYSSDYRDGFLARIVKAVKENRLRPGGAGNKGNKGQKRNKSINNQRDFKLTEDFLEDLENLPPLQDIDFEDFEQQVEVIARNSGF